MGEKECTEDFYEDFKKIAEASNQIYQMAEQAFIPKVDTIIQTHCTDFRTIDKLLDDLLSFACDDRILILFKRLCRYYYPINPEITAYYDDAYRRMWDDNESENEELV